MWSSKEADRRSGANITGFKNEEVDVLIEKQKTIFDVSQRNDIYRTIDQIIYEQFPYVLSWYLNYIRLLYWNKFGTPETVLPKYGGEYAPIVYWWLDEDSAADLKDAIANKQDLPPREATIYFDELFQPQ
jgi:microcin C transport system substrate-binding protein